MKSIELTEYHKSKLLEMCTKLFPKNKLDSLQFGTLKFLINYYEKKDPNNSKITFGGWDKIIEIHWFEFCMTHLAEKILDNSFYDIETSELGYFGYGPNIKENHPIDYLYEEFKN